MGFGAIKCAMLIMKNWEKEPANGIKLPNQGSIERLKRNKTKSPRQYWKLALSNCGDVGINKKRAFERNGILEIKFCCRNIN